MKQSKARFMLGIHSLCPVSRKAVQRAQPVFQQASNNRGLSFYRPALA